MTTELTPRQLKQLEKQNRRKKYADLAIQGTNNSSIASKRSVEVLYLSKLSENDRSTQANEYFKYFVKKTPKRSPCINRGYWLRLHAIRSRLDSIVEATQKKIVVVNLGCGFDPLPFQLLDPNNEASRKYSGRVRFLDLDYPDLISKKVQIIKQNDELTNILGPECDELSDAVKFGTVNYIAAPCNLNYLETFKKDIVPFGLDDPELIKVFVAEVSLAYMKPERADDIIKLCGELPNSHFLMLEQLIPEGENEPFSKQMLKHFRKNDSPLLSVLQYKTLQSQRERFSKLGFPNINAGDMFKLWESVDVEQRLKVKSLELFDELEEFHLFCHHYIICHATNDTGFAFDGTYKFTPSKSIRSLEILTEAKFQILESSLARKFGAAAQDKLVLYFGGSSPARLNELIEVDVDTGNYIPLDTGEAPPVRMCHTLTSLGSSQEFMMIGGRQSPKDGYTDTWVFNMGSNLWRQGPSLPESRYRHTACLIENQILVFGGSTTGSPFLTYDPVQQTFKTPDHNLDLDRPLISAAMDYNHEAQVGVIVGGSFDETLVSDALYTFSYNGNTVKIKNSLKHPLLQRYGAKVKFINSHTLMLVGGTSPEMLFGQETSIVIIDIKSGKICGLKIHPDIWDDHPLFLVGFELVQISLDEFLVIGGGATCYGFGSVANKSFKISISNILNGLD